MAEASLEEDHQTGEEVRISMDNVDECNLSRKEKESLEELQLSNFDSLKEYELKAMFRNRNQHQRPEIGSVTSILSNNEDLKEYFKPSFIGIGPLQLNFKNEAASDYAKKRMTNRFLKGSGTTIQALYCNIKAEIRSLITCYEVNKLRQAYESASINYEDASVAMIFLEDGCAVLQFIYCIANDKLMALEILTNRQIKCLKRDLFLLENQLPYKLLNLLINSCSKQRAAELCLSIKKFIDDNVMIQTKKMEWQQQEQEPAHLLALLRERMIFQDQSVEKAQCFGSGCLPKIKKLNERGIWLRASKTSSSLKDISFHRGIFNCGRATLMLPPIMVDEYTVPKLMNLIAYEMTPSWKNGFEVSSYLSFLDSLMEQREDMKELIDAGVVINFLRSNEDAANLFNKIGRNLTPNLEAYSDVEREIKQHFDTAGATYIAPVYYRALKGLDIYFGNPWSFLALGGAILGLVLTAIQTYYSIPSNK